MSTSWKKYRNSLILLLLVILYPFAVSLICPTGMKNYLEKEEIDASALFYSENDFSRRNYYQNRTAQDSNEADTASNVLNSLNNSLP